MHRIKFLIVNLENGVRKVHPASLNKKYLGISSSNGDLKMERDLQYMKRIMEKRGKQYFIII
jgi:hypothetical protein